MADERPQQAGEPAVMQVEPTKSATRHSVRMAIVSLVILACWPGVAQGQATIRPGLQPDRQPAETPYALSGIGLWFGGVLPGDHDYGNTSGGVGFDGFYWLERPYFAVQPRVGIHFDTDTSENRFLEVPLDVGVFFIPIRSFASPYFGGGGGIRFIHEQRPIFVRTGTILITEATNEREESGVGGSIYGRVGFLFARTSSFRVNLNVDYNLTFLELNGQANPGCLSFGVSFIF